MLAVFFDRRTPKTADRPLRCSFCQKTQDEVRKLVAGPTVFICDECVDICAGIIEDDAGRSPDSRAPHRRDARVAEFVMGRHLVACTLCGRETPRAETLTVGERGVICGSCADEVDAALAKGKPASS